MTADHTEAIAAIVYEAMRFERLENPSPWVADGNSLAQNEARKAARRIVNLNAARPAQPADEAVVGKIADIATQEVLRAIGRLDILSTELMPGILRSVHAALAAIPPQPDDFARGWVACQREAVGYHNQCAANFDAHLAKVKSTKATPDIARWAEIERQAEVHREHAAAISSLPPPASAGEG